MQPSFLLKQKLKQVQRIAVNCHQPPNAKTIENVSRCKLPTVSNNSCSSGHVFTVSFAFHVSELPTVHQDYTHRQWTSVLLHGPYLSGRRGGKDQLCGEKRQRLERALPRAPVPNRRLQSVSLMSFVSNAAWKRREWSLENMCVLVYACLCACCVAKNFVGGGTRVIARILSLTRFQLRLRHKY